MMEKLGKLKVDKGLLHVMTDHGEVLRFKDGVLHAIGEPAVIREDGTLEFWVGGMLHREAGPAIVYPDGRCAWYSCGLLIRETGPSVVFDRREAMSSPISPPTVYPDV